MDQWDNVSKDLKAGYSKEEIVIEVCACDQDVHYKGEDSLSYCPACEYIVESHTRYITLKDFEAIHGE